ncbi:MAG: hypothetical protein R2838_21520 [Caldilineaceae bacterium]
MSTQADTPVKGSWEALLQQANAYAANYNDEAIPLFEKIYTRLQKMPRAQRHAANQRLQNIYMQAAINLHAYLIMRERYDEGMAIIPAIEEEMGPDETTRWEIHAAQLLKQQGRDDDAVARLRALAEKPESDLDVWGDWAACSCKLRRFDAADAVTGMDEWVAEHHDADARRRDAAAVASLRASAALRRREWEEAGRWLDTAADLDEEFGRRRILLPVELLRGRVQVGRSFPAKLPPRESPPNSAPQPLETGRDCAGGGHLARDHRHRPGRRHPRPQRDGAGQLLPGRQEAKLSTVLGVLSENTGQAAWGVYSLAGLGWAVRGNVKSAKADMETAMLQRRAGGEGRRLPYSAWHHLTDLADAPMQQALAPYFETSED